VHVFPMMTADVLEKCPFRATPVRRINGKNLKDSF
jgi:hypothetical protein